MELIEKQQGVGMQGAKLGKEQSRSPYRRGAVSLADTVQRPGIEPIGEIPK
jgi:hypothetical protein